MRRQIAASVVLTLALLATPIADVRAQVECNPEISECGYQQPTTGTVTIHKVVAGSETSASAFSFTLIQGESSVSVPQDNATTMSPGVYTISESGPEVSGSWNTTYSESCSDGRLTVIAGTNVDCTVTNTYVDPTIVTGGGGSHASNPTATVTVITRVTNDNGGTSGPSDFVASVTTGGSPIYLSGTDGSGATLTVAVGAYVITPGTVPGYAWTIGGDCDGTLSGGQTAVCTIDEADTADSVIEPPTDGSPTDSATDTTFVVDSGTDTPTVVPAPIPPVIRLPTPAVLGATDVGNSPVDSSTAPLVIAAPTVTVQTGAACTWFMPWFICYWWILVLLALALYLAYRAWKKATKDENKK